MDEMAGNPLIRQHAAFRHLGPFHATAPAHINPIEVLENRG